MPFPFGGANTLFNFGGQGAPQGVPATPIMLELARQNAAAQNAIDPKHSEPAYSPWQLAGVIAKGLQGWGNQGYVSGHQDAALNQSSSNVSTTNPASVSNSDATGPNQDASLDPMSTNPQTHNVGMNNAGLYDRSKIQQEAEGNPRVKQLFKAMMVAEAGPDAPPESMAAIGETAANRTYAYNGLPSPRKDLGPFNGSLWRTLQDDYYAPWKDGNLKRSFAELNNPEINAKAEQAYKLVMGGSDFAKGNLHNGSADVAEYASRHHGNFIRDPYNREGYSTKIGGPGDIDERPLLSKIPKRDMTQVASAEGTAGLPMTDTGFIPSNMPPRSALGLDGAPNTPQQPTPAAQPQGTQVAQNVPQPSAGFSPSNAPAEFSVIPGKPFTREELGVLGSLPETTQRLIIENRMRQFSPQVTHTPQGDVYYRNQGNKFDYVGKPQEMTVSGGGAAIHAPAINTAPGAPYQMNVPGALGSQGGGDLPTQLGTFGSKAKIAGEAQQALEGELQTYRDHTKDLADTLQMLQAQREAMNDPTYSSGFGQHEIGLVQKALSRIPGYEGTASSTELAEKLNAKNVLDQLSSFTKDAHVGRVLSSEVNYMREAQGTPDVTIAGRKAINEIQQRVVKRALALAQRGQEYAHNESSNPDHLDMNWNEERRKWVSDPNNMAFKPGEIENYRKILELDKEQKSNPLNIGGPSEGNKGPKRLVPSRDNPNKYEYR